MLRRKARHEAGGDDPSPVTSDEIIAEVQRFIRTSDRLSVPSGNYL